MALLILFSLLSGFVTVLSPCVLPSWPAITDAIAIGV